MFAPFFCSSLSFFSFFLFSELSRSKPKRRYTAAGRSGGLSCGRLQVENKQQQTHERVSSMYESHDKKQG